MNRRKFLGTTLALAAVPFAPTAEPARLVGWRSFHIAESCTAILNDGWVAFVHPSIERDLRDMAARDQWQGAYRAWRVAGRPEKTPREILGDYRPFTMPAEVGVIRDFVLN